MKAIRLLFLLLMFLPVTLNAQTEEQELLAAPQTGADSTVLVVPYRELITERLDALVDDSLMEVPSRPCS